MNNNGKDLGERLIQYAARIIGLLKTFDPSSKPEKHMSDQLLRSSTSVGANYEEARAAESKADFIHKMQVSLKEMRESYYWIRLVERTSIIVGDEIEELCDESKQLRAILSKCVVTAKTNKPKS